MTTPIAQSVDTLASGRTSTSPFITVIKDRAPTGNDGINGQFQVGQRWIDTATGNSEYFLLGFTSSNGIVQANWVLLVSGTSTVETLTGNSGTPVTPDGANNINVVGDGTTGLLFDGASHTLTGTLNDIPNSALANDSISLVAGNGITISVSPVALGGSTTISAMASVPTSFTEDTGVATPVLNNLNIFGAGGIDTTGSGDTVTIDGSGVTDTLVFDADSGTASPSAGVLNVVGGGGITTSGLGNTLTISGTGFLESVIIQTFTASGTYTPTSGMTYCIIEVVGGGAAGGGAAATGGSQYSAGSGGGAGEYARGYFSAATIGVSKTVTIGAGGTGVSGGTGNSGGTTSVVGLITAAGGTGGQAIPANNLGSSRKGGLGGTGGTGGQVRTPGVPGTLAFINYANFVLYTGAGGSSQYGAGGRATTDTGTGEAALGYGSGGGGGDNDQNLGAKAGGAGTAGIVIVTEYVS